MSRGIRTIHPQWVHGPATQNHLWLPPQGWQAARIIALLRAGLADPDTPEVWHTYHRDLLPSTEAHLLADDWLADLNARPVGEWLGFSPGVAAFIECWFLGSLRAYFTLLAVLRLDALHVDPLAIDSQRARFNEQWGLLYGPEPSNRPGRREQRALRKLVHKTWGWERHQDSTVMRRARMWWRWHNVHQSLTAAVREYLDEQLEADPDDANQSSELDQIGNWSRWLRPYTQDLNLSSEEGGPP